MLDSLLTEQIRNDDEIAGMLARYNGRPAFFFQKSPQDTDPGWQKPCFPRVDYNVDMSYSAERKTSGSLNVNVWCSSESAFMPEDIERRLRELIHGAFYTESSHGAERAQEAKPALGSTVCAIWARSDAFSFDSPTYVGTDTAPEVFGITLSFDLSEFPAQYIERPADNQGRRPGDEYPDPVSALNAWTCSRFHNAVVIGCVALPPVWKPSDETPAIYWRAEGEASTDRQSYSVTWFEGRYAAHVVSPGVASRNGVVSAMLAALQRDGEVMMADGSPMFVRQTSARHGADPLRDGQIALTGRYGILTGGSADNDSQPLRRINFIK